MAQYRETYGAISSNSSIDETIYRCLDDLPESVAHEVAKRLIKQRSELGDPAYNTFGELLAGAYLARQGIQIEYEREFEAPTPGSKGPTPDWTTASSKGGPPRLIVDVVTHYPPQGARDQLAKGGFSIRFVDDGKRLYDKIDEKAGKYSVLASKHNSPLVVAIHSHFAAGIFPDQIDDILLDPVIAERTDLSGVVFFEGRSARPRVPVDYYFSFHPHPTGSRAYKLKPEVWRSR
jgi:hypothetical protein